MTERLRLLTEGKRREFITNALRLDPVTGMRRGLTNDEFVKQVASAQDKETLKAVIKDLEMIMKEAPDLKSLEKMIADYIAEKHSEIPEEGK